ncbi:MAG: hypothetical protein ACWGO1_02470 [Anaerolineales bacterium]
MSENPPEKDNLADALHQLGQSLANTIQAAWDHPERKRVQAEIEKGLTDMSETLNKEVENIRQSPTGQQIKADVDEFAEKVRTGETGDQLRQELLKVLQFTNNELERVASKLRRSETGQPSETPPEKEAE